VVEELQTVKPERFGRYILLDRIGVGGMAEVFRAVMPGAGGFKRMFVVKRILSQFCQSPTFVEMFVREAKLGALLSHPNIAQVYDFGSVNGEYFLALEYLRGHDLLALMRRLRETKQRFPVSVAAFIAHQTAVGLAFAHDLRGPDGAPLDIIHRDVTPSNIMCLGTGGVKLLDFGIAKSVAEVGVERTEEGGFRGKLAYMSPERIRNEPFDARSDLYSLGVVLWEILTGKRLFRGKNDVDTLRNVLEMPVPPPSSLRPEIPASLDRAVARALARNADDRYPTGQAMVEDLEPILAETTFHSRQVSQLLVELYGSGTPSSQIALACLTPDVLAGFDQEPAVPTGGLAAAAGAELTALDRRGRRTRRRRLWGGLAAAAALVATLGAVMGTRAGGSVPHAGPIPSLAATVTVPPSAIPRPTAAPGPARSDPPAEDASETPEPSSGTTKAPHPNRSAHAAAKARGALPSRRAPSPRSANARDAIASGRSIDPFAEAAQRGAR
jgi:eukaryotic-like serine/threonine-protein kinase